MLISLGEPEWVMLGTEKALKHYSSYYFCCYYSISVGHIVIDIQKDLGCHWKHLFQRVRISQEDFIKDTQKQWEPTRNPRKVSNGHFQELPRIPRDGFRNMVMIKLKIMLFQGRSLVEELELIFLERQSIQLTNKESDQ